MDEQSSRSHSITLAEITGEPNPLQAAPTTALQDEEGRVTAESLWHDSEIQTYIQKSDEYLGSIGYTEHGPRHVHLVSSIARNIMLHLGFPKREAELAAIAGLMHDIGNLVARHDHGQTSACLSYPILLRHGMSPEEIAPILAAMGNHEEETGSPVNSIAAALILADKSDAHRSRVRNTDLAKFDIHDRVNYAVTRSFVRVDVEHRTITLELSIDTAVAPVMEYFEIFMSRMIMCRRAATFLGSQFKLLFNDVQLL
ncbi:MAG: HD domain-containing protein [Symbiobacteriia bacterium]